MADKPVDPKNQIFDLTLMSNFVHQVVNPLNAVCGTLDNIIRGDVPPGSVNQRIRACRSQIEYCIELIRNLAFLAEYQRDPRWSRMRVSSSSSWASSRACAASGCPSMLPSRPER